MRFPDLDLLDLFTRHLGSRGGTIAISLVVSELGDDEFFIVELFDRLVAKEKIRAGIINREPIKQGAPHDAYFLLEADWDHLYRDFDNNTHLNLGKELELEIRLLGGTSEEYYRYNPFEGLLDISEANLDQIAHTITKMNVETLILTGNDIVEIPSVITEGLTQLKSLTMMMNRLRCIPDNISDLHNLRVLDLKYNEISEISENISKLPYLETLDLNANSIYELPCNISDLNSLIFLDIGENNIQKLPEMSNFEELMKLKISGDLTELPGSICELSNLEHLELYTKELKILPDDIGKLEKLIHLEIYVDKLSSLPVSIGDLHNLQHLIIRSDMIKLLPDNICNLNKLINLELELKSLETLPDNLINMTSLRYLYINEHNFMDIPNCIRGLEFLDSLAISPSFENKINTVIFERLIDNGVKVIGYLDTPRR